MPLSPLFARRSAGLILALSACTLGAVAQRPALTSHVPVMVHTGQAEKVQAVASSQTLQLVLNLPLRNQAGLQGLLADLYNPQSPNFHHWLSSTDFDAQFGPSADDYAAVIMWAHVNGLTVVQKSANKRVVTVQGTAQVINSAFHVQLTTYHDKVRNRDFHAPDREPTMDLDVPLLSISGLDTSNPRVKHSSKELSLPDSISAAGKSTPTPRTGSGPSGQYLPTDMRKAYYGSGPLTGTGQTVGIFSYDGYLPNDLTIYTTKTGMPQPVPVVNVLTGGFDGGCELSTPCDDGEQVIDIVQVEGFAPGLTQILFYEGLSAVTELNQMVMDNTAKVITSSWGGGDFGPGTTPYFMQMAAQGQTFLNATGDSGGFNGFTYLPPSSDPWVLQMGGTDLTTVTATQAWATEPAWVDSGGGYFDPAITIPTWQQAAGVITAANLGSTTLRNAPDMAMEANFDNPTVVNGAYTTGYGGTSFAAPRMAGYLALANQQSVAAGNSTIGYINPQLYDYGTRSTASTTFHDVTSGHSTSASGNPTLTYNATAGYDLATGWGSPNGTGLLNLLTGPDYSIAFASTAVNVVRGSQATVNFTVTPLNGFTATPTFTFSGLPATITASYVSNGGNSYTATLTSSSTSTVGTYPLVITATANSVSHSATMTVNAVKRVDADFGISATNASLVQLASGGSTITVTPSASLSGAVSLAVTGLPAGVTAQLAATDTTSSNSIALTFSASIASAPGTYPVTITGSYAGATGTLTHSVVINVTLAGVASVLPDGDFEATTSPWTFTSTTANAGYLCSRAACGYYPHSGTNYAYLNGFGAVDTDTLSQQFTISGGTTSATLNYWLWVNTQETTTTTKSDTITVTLLNSSGTLLTTLGTFSNLDHSSTYVLHSVDLSAYLGQTVTLKYQGVESRTKATSFMIDDVSVVVK